MSTTSSTIESAGLDPELLKLKVAVADLVDECDRSGRAMEEAAGLMRRLGREVATLRELCKRLPHRRVVNGTAAAPAPCARDCPACAYRRHLQTLGLTL